MILLQYLKIQNHHGSSTEFVNLCLENSIDFFSNLNNIWKFELNISFSLGYQVEVL